MNHYLIYQAYGKAEIFHEAIYSIHSLLRRHSSLNFKIIIVTDDSAFFKKYLNDGIIYHEVNKEQIKTWRGSIDFVHRVKIEVLQMLSKQYSGSFLYVDTDIYFLNEIDSLFQEIEQGKTIMCFKENAINKGKNVLYRRLNQFVQSKKNKSVITPDTIMYNAGVLGFNSSFFPILDSVKSLTDQLYQKHPTFIIEQLAFSYYLQQHGKVIETEGKWVFHYWNFKEFRQVLAYLFENYKKTDDLFAIFDKNKVDEMIVPKRVYESLPSWKRKIKKLLKNTWVMPEIKT